MEPKSIARAVVGDTCSGVGYRISLVQFDAPNPLPWAEMATKYFQLFDFRKPDAEAKSLISGLKNMFGNSEFNYDAPVDKSLKGWHYYLIGGREVSELKLVKAVGTIRFVGGSGTRTTHFGALCAHASDLDEAAPGFVYVSKEELKFSTSVVPKDWLKVQGDMVKYEASDLRTTTIVVKSSEQMPSRAEFLQEVVVKPSGQKLLFARWPAGQKPPQCSSAYSLFDIGDSPSLVLSNDFDCDI